MRLLYKYGNATLYSVRIADRMISLLISLNSFQSSSAASPSLNNGSNFGPPGISTSPCLKSICDRTSKSDFYPSNRSIIARLNDIQSISVKGNAISCYELPLTKFTILIATAFESMVALGVRWLSTSSNSKWGVFTVHI